MTDLTNKPVVSVCIANFNGEALIADCIESVRKQGDDLSIEIIVHDDASTDASVSLIRTDYPEIVLIDSEENVGFCVANNRMTRVARGEFILLLNNDAALLDDAISTLLRVARSYPDGAILSLPQYDWDTGALVDFGCRADLSYFPVPIVSPHDKTEPVYVIGACFWIPRQLWNELGGFPEWMGSIAEDLYLCSIAKLKRIPIYVPHASGYRHRQGASFGGNKLSNGHLVTTLRRRFLSERNRGFVLIVATPGPLIWAILTLHLFTLLAEGMVLALLLRNWPLLKEVYLRAFSELLCTLPALLRRRTAIQSTRTITVRRFLSPFVLIPRKLTLLVHHGFPKVQ